VSAREVNAFGKLDRVRVSFKKTIREVNVIFPTKLTKKKAKPSRFI